MYKPAIAFAVSALSLCAVSNGAQACGESMFERGISQRYHAFITRQPADILIYRPNSTDADSNRQLYTGLERAGHHVTLATDEQAFTHALGNKHFDVIIADAADMDAVAARLDKSSRQPALVAIVGKGEKSERYPRAVHVGDGVNQYLKSIEQSMQKRGA